MVLYFVRGDRHFVGCEEGGGVAGVEGASVPALAGDLDLDGVILQWDWLTVPSEPGVIVANGIG